MYTAEKIIASYCNYILGWATIPNIKCDRGQYEIDLIAIDPKSGDKYHIECSVLISSSFSKLTDKEFSPEKLKQRVEKPKQRMTIDYFKEIKFGAPEVIEKLKQYGFREGEYGKIIVADGWTEEAEKRSKEYGIELWDFNEKLTELIEYCEKSTKYYEDDTLRSIQFLLRALKKKGRR